MPKCVICGQKPANGDGIFCVNCKGKIDADKQRRKNDQPVKFLVYKDYVVGLYRNGEAGKYHGKLLGRDADKLPKNKTLNLNHYCEGYDRGQIKRLKAKVLALAEAPLH